MSSKHQGPHRRPPRRISCRVTAIAYEDDDCWMELSSEDLPNGAPKLLVVLNPPTKLLERSGFQFMEGIRLNDQTVDVDPDFPQTVVSLDVNTGLIYVDGREDPWAGIERKKGQDCLRLLPRRKP